MHGVTVLITGAASGLGEAWCRGFIDEGATVVAVDISRQGLAQRAAEGALTRVVDVADEDAVRDMVNFTVAETGRLDVLFNNAGIAHNRPFLDIPAHDFERHMAVHCFGAVYGMRYALPEMLRAGAGRIINTISRAAEISGAHNAAYASAKAALWSVTHAVAAEYADNPDIRINMLIPGPTNTAIWGRDMPQMQSPEVTFPTARMLATLPPAGAHGEVFWDEEPYPLFANRLDKT